MGRIQHVVICLLLTGMFGLTSPCLTPPASGAEPPSRQQTASPVASTQTVRVGDIDVAYRVIGTGYPLLLVTGYSATMDMWDPYVLKELSSRYKVVIFDNRGAGSTTAGQKPFSIPLFAEDTVGLMDALHIGKAHILGWSMGTFVASELALRHPDRVAKLVLYAGYCGGQEMVRPEPAVYAAMQDLSGTAEEKGRRWISILFPPRWLKEHPDFVKQLPRPSREVATETIKRQGEAIGAWPGVCKKLNRLVQPTLLITGTEDVIIPPANSLILASLVPDCSLILMPGGHANMYQYPRAFSRYLLTFLDE